uniref:DDE Tnp4 domain-containing protein n=1 Tax=Sinocyclocheilus rhinocerous TaxID=307959 RepID=A0A673HQ67_9TELE
MLLLYKDVCRFYVIWAYPRTYEWWSYINNTWTNREWLQNFRMQRCTFLMLCDTLRPWLTCQNTTYRKPVPVEVRVAICIWRLATNLEYRSISHLFGVGLTTCSIITQEVVTAINMIMTPQYIKTPSLAEFRIIVQGFRDKWRFPQVAGCIDGTHINIKAPPNMPADYYIRKGNYSIILQGVVDNKLMFWDINVGQPGKIHDARVFFERGSSDTLLPTWTETFAGVDVPLVLLGDSTYPLSHWLMKPYPEGRGVTPEQIQFNHHLSQARTTVERAFGHLKVRWRCLLKQCEAHITLISRIASACCVLHNYCEVHNEEFLPRDVVQEEEQENEDVEHRGQEHAQGNDIRDALCRYFCRNLNQMYFYRVMGLC